MTTILLGRICRTCLKKSAGMFKLCEFVKDDLQIESMLSQTVPNFDLDVDDIPLPVEICEECLSKLRTSYDFVQMCLKSNKELKNVLNQQEHEIETTLEDGKIDMSSLEFLDETPIFIDNFKKEPHDDNSNVSHGQANGGNEKDQDLKIQIVKLEVDMQNESHHDDNSSSDEYWPNDDKEDSDSNFFEQMAKGGPLDRRAKRKYHRKVPLKRGGSKVCLHCNKVFAKKNLLTKHLSVHDSEHQFVCDLCEYRFSSERKLKTHRAKHSSVEISFADGPYPCPDCPMIFHQPRALAAHSVIHSDREFKCEVCEMSLKTMSAVTRHMNSKHPDVLPYKCNLCDKSFPVENHLNDHINEHMGYKKHKCDFCDKSFPHTTALKDHVRVHTGESPFLCAHCGKAFKTANVLRQHLQRHGEKKFHCPECPMKFYLKVNLTKHMSCHTKLKPHVCDICGSAFTRQDSLKAHKFKHTGARPFKCEDCNMSFVFKRHLKRHKITHTGEKPHMCTFCDRAYAASGDLVKHLRTHVGEKTYFCDECPESFKYSLDLKDHKNLHYKEKLNLEERSVITVEIGNEQLNLDETNVITVEIPNEDIEMHTEDTVVTLEELYEVDQTSE